MVLLSLGAVGAGGFLFYRRRNEQSRRLTVRNSAMDVSLFNKMNADSPSSSSIASRSHSSGRMTHAVSADPTHAIAGSDVAYGDMDDL